MNLAMIPRHQIETTMGDYGRMLAALVGGGKRNLRRRFFEARFAQYVGCRHAIAVASGRLGMHLVLKHLAVKRDTEAIIPAFNYFAVIERFLNFGLRPVFADIRGQDLNVNPENVKTLIGPQTKLLLATHMFGHPCDMDDLRLLADRHDLLLIEDCAHAFGSRYRGQHVGTFGKAGVFSLSVMKLITTFGGGMITTNDDELAERIRDDLDRTEQNRSSLQHFKRFAKGALLDFGTKTLPFTLAAWPALRLARAVRPDFQKRLMTDVPRRVTRWDSDRIASFSAFQAVLGLSQLQRADELIGRRRQVMRWLDDALQGMDTVTLTLPKRSTCAEPNGLYYGILVDQPDRLAHHLFARGIDSETSEYCNCADLAIYEDFRGDCPVARDIQRRILRIPSHPGLSKGAVRRIARVIRSFEQPMPAASSWVPLTR